MSQQNPNLDAFFGKAKSEPPVVSAREIDRLLDHSDMHGRLSEPDTSASPTEFQRHSNNKRRIIMTSIAAMIAAGIIGASAYFVSMGSDTSPLNGNVLEEPVSTEVTTATPPPDNPSVAIPAAIDAVPGSAVDVASPSSIAPNPVPVAQSLNGNDGDGNDETVDTESLQKELSGELGKFIEEYWVEKINGYRNRIDRVLSPSSLDELNRLRVRYALVDKSNTPFNFDMSANSTISGKGKETLVIRANAGNRDAQRETAPNWTAQNRPENADGPTAEHQLAMSIEINSDSDQDSNAKNVDVTRNKTVTIRRSVDSPDTDLLDEMKDIDITVTKNGEGGKIVVVDPEDPDNRKEFALDDLGESERKILVKKMLENEDVAIDGTGRKKVIIRRRLSDNGDEADSDMSMEDVDMTPIVGMLKMAISADKSESSQIVVATWGVAEQNRTELDGLKETIFNDLETFKTKIGERIADFVRAHRDEMSEDMIDLLTSQSDQASKMLGSDVQTIAQILDPVYDVIIEPMILLYNGSDINGMLSSTIAQPVAGVSLEANTTLKQSYPNPASTKTTIEFSLREPSARTELRLFDSNGGEVRIVDLGAQSSGTHSTTLDLSDLPAGMYLYHLTVETGEGEQVFSKTLQVAR